MIWMAASSAEMATLGHARRVTYSATAGWKNPAVNQVSARHLAFNRASIGLASINTKRRKRSHQGTGEEVIDLHNREKGIPPIDSLGRSDSNASEE